MLRVWKREAARRVSAVPTAEICCYPVEFGFVTAVAESLQRALDDLPDPAAARILFSAHGLPKRIVARGDPYQWQVEQTVQAVMERLGTPETEDWKSTRLNSSH